MNEESIYYNSTILITGSTGFIGGLLVNMLLSINNSENAGISLLLPVRDIKKARDKNPITNERFMSITLYETSMEDLKPSDIDMPIDYIFHCASVTASSIMTSNPVEVADGIVLGTRYILELARQKHVKSMVYLSSMEVYGRTKDTDVLVTEDMLGDLNLFSARSCYPLGKRMAEHYCYAYHKEYGLPVKIARLAQTFGTGINSDDNRVFAQFARAVLQNRDIILHTNGLSMGNYCESQDALKALFTILINGQNGEAYNVVNEENTMRIGEMAEMVAKKIAGGRIKVVYDLENDNRYGYAKDTELKLSSEKLRELGWKPTKNIEEMYQDLITWMEQQ
jgi:nucleoside-diphosphate-sugar epimerase